MFEFALPEAHLKIPPPDIKPKVEQQNLFSTELLEMYYNKLYI